MCGIAGVVRLDDRPPPSPTVVEAMLQAIGHRGPDGEGVHALGDVVLGACRLVIVDTTDGGRQPMATDDGLHHLVFNGELYDHAARRRALIASGERFRSRSDTEVLLRMLARDGERVLNELTGMFAFGWWDAARRRLLLGRDRFGEKPLFFAKHAGCLWFASEEKALFAAGVPCTFDRDAWPELMFFRYVAGDRTPYQGVNRLLPGHVLEVIGGEVEVRRWWDGPEPNRASATPKRFRSLLDASVRLRLQADVPVGVLLSGGLDSSSVARLASQATSEPVHAYTVGYPGHRMDEADHARLVASASNLRHHEVVIDPVETPGLLEEMTRLRGETLTHAATTHLLALSRVASQDVKVLVSGEGADELLGGYGRYQRFRLGHLTGAAALAGVRCRGRAGSPASCACVGATTASASSSPREPTSTSRSLTPWSTAARSSRQRSASGRRWCAECCRTTSTRIFSPSSTTRTERRWAPGSSAGCRSSTPTSPMRPRALRPPPSTACTANGCCAERWRTIFRSRCSGGARQAGRRRTTVTCSRCPNCGSWCDRCHPTRSCEARRCHKP